MKTITENQTPAYWWTNLLKKHKADKWSGGYALVEEASNLIEESVESEKEIFIDYLTKVAIMQETGAALALAVLVNQCTPRAVRAIYEKAKTLRHDDSAIIGYLRVIGRHGEEEHLHLLEDFLLSDPLNKHHSSLQWSVYPRFPELFAMAYSRYLTETSYAKWTGSAIVQSFMSKPEALKVLKSYLEKKNKGVWLQFRSDIEAELKKDIWARKDKAAIRKVI